MKSININNLPADVIDLWMNRWLLLTSGTMDDCNMMTVAWGSIGCMWAKPFAQIVVRPQRHTRTYLEKGDTFTLCAFPEEFRDDLQTLGSVSGRDGDKLSKTGLTLKASSKVAAPSYNEADLVLECRKIYRQVMDPAGFLDNEIMKNYPSKDFHTIYFGEIVAAFA